MNNIRIRRACACEADALTKISFSAKNHWNYPQDYFRSWKDELTITAAYIDTNIVHVAELAERLVGYYSVVENTRDKSIGTIKVEKGFWLEHMFVLPEFIGTGIGTKLIEHMRQHLLSLTICEVLIFVDPHAKGFYEKMGAVFKRESDSSIKGRRIPVYEMTFANSRLRL